MICRWDDLPERMKTPETRAYYERLAGKSAVLFVKRIFDIVLSILLIVLLAPVMCVLSAVVGLTSPGGVFFRQERVTKYLRIFKIIKFRTMTVNASETGLAVTVEGDERITPAGVFLRKFRLDEIPQLFNILRGEMSFVGARPEVLSYVLEYSDEMYATLLLPAGLTSRASIQYKDEERILAASVDVHGAYIDQILPAKMAYNLAYLKKFGILEDCRVLIGTIIAVFTRE